MSKFHINDNGEVKRCSASVRECQFSGSEENSNHFDTVYEAQAEATKRNEEKYGELNSHSKSRTRIKEEYAPRMVPNALSEEEIRASRPDSNNKHFKKYNETVEIFKGLKIESKVDQEVSYMLEDIVGHDKDDMMSDDGITDHLYEWQNSDSPETREAAARVHKMLRN